MISGSICQNICLLLSLRTKLRARAWNHKTPASPHTVDGTLQMRDSTRQTKLEAAYSNSRSQWGLKHWSIAPLISQILKCDLHTWLYIPQLLIRIDISLQFGCLEEPPEGRNNAVKRAEKRLKGYLKREKVCYSLKPTGNKVQRAFMSTESQDGHTKSVAVTVL